MMWISFSPTEVVGFAKKRVVLMKISLYLQREQEKRSPPRNRVIFTKFYYVHRSMINSVQKKKADFYI